MGDYRTGSGIKTDCDIPLYLWSTIFDDSLFANKSAKELLLLLTVTEIYIVVGGALRHYYYWMYRPLGRYGTIQNFHVQYVCRWRYHQYKVTVHVIVKRASISCVFLVADARLSLAQPAPNVLVQ